MIKFIENKSIDAIRARLNGTKQRERELQRAVENAKVPPEQRELERVQQERSAVEQELQQAEAAVKAETQAKAITAYRTQQGKTAAAFFSALLEMDNLARLEDAAVAASFDISSCYSRLFPGEINHTQCNAIRRLSLIRPRDLNTSPTAALPEGLRWLFNLYRIDHNVLPDDVREFCAAIDRGERQYQESKEQEYAAFRVQHAKRTAEYRKRHPPLYEPTEPCNSVTRIPLSVERAQAMSVAKGK